MSSEFIRPSIANTRPAPTVGGAASFQRTVGYVILLVFAALTQYGDAAAISRNGACLATPLNGLGLSRSVPGYITTPSFTSGASRFKALYAQRWKYTRVTLLKDTPHVGKQGEVAIVNRNYAFNYLVPFGFARYTTRAELIGISLKKDFKEALVNVRKASAMDLKTRLGKDTVLQFNIPAKEKGSNTLISPLLPIHIIDKMREMKLLLAVDMLREQDVEILSEDGIISTFGVHKVLLKADPEITIEIAADVKEQPVDTSFIKDVLL